MQFRQPTNRVEMTRQFLQCVSDTKSLICMYPFMFLRNIAKSIALLHQFRKYMNLAIQHSCAVYWLTLACCIDFTDGLAWDWINQKLYLTDECLDQISVFDPSTGIHKVLVISRSSSSIRGIAVDPTTRSA